MRIHAEVLDGPAADGARSVARALLDDADEAATRLGAGTDEEALHDFRVGVRRLRSALRAFRPWLGERVGRRVEKKLRRCAHATNAPRDAEVQLAWLDSVAGTPASVRGPAAEGAQFVARYVRAQRDAAPPLAGTLERYARASRKLARRLAPDDRTIAAPERHPDATFGKAIATLATRQLERALNRIDRARSASDREGVHRARIELKRLRYLLEPLRGVRPADARPAVERIKALQDLLGELHDVHVLAEEIAALREHDAGERQGVAALERLLEGRRDQLFAEFARKRDAGEVEALAADVRELSSALGSR